MGEAPVSPPATPAVPLPSLLVSKDVDGLQIVAMIVQAELPKAGGQFTICADRPSTVYCYLTLPPAVTPSQAVPFLSVAGEKSDLDTIPASDFPARLAAFFGGQDGATPAHLLVQRNDTADDPMIVALGGASIESVIRGLFPTVSKASPRLH